MSMSRSDDGKPVKSIDPELLKGFEPTFARTLFYFGDELICVFKVIASKLARLTWPKFRLAIDL